MSEANPTGPYVYQPFGSVTSCQERIDAERFYGVGGVSLLADIKGLTKAEADRVCAALKNGSPQAAPVGENDV